MLDKLTPKNCKDRDATYCKGNDKNTILPLYFTASFGALITFNMLLVQYP